MPLRRQIHGTAKPGQAPTAAHDTAIESQIFFVSGPSDVSSMELTKTSSGGGFSKSTISKIDESGFASDDWRSGFYANYRSQRYVDGVLMLRLRRLPPAGKIAELGHTFKDILGRRGIRASEPSKVEIDDEDELDCERLAAHFNQSSFGRLRRLIDELNRY